jgi:hypothetical protein
MMLPQKIGIKYLNKISYRMRDNTLKLGDKDHFPYCKFISIMVKPCVHYDIGNPTPRMYLNV